MSAQCGKLVSLILNEHFGEVVQKVGYHLFKHGVSPLWSIVKFTELPIPKVKLALCILIKYGLAVFETGKTEACAEYKLVPDNVLLILRYPKFVSHIKKLFGEESEILLEETLIRGYAVASDLVLQVVSRMKKNHNKDVTLVDVRDKFVCLVTAKYLKRYPEQGVEEAHRYLIPSINLGQIQTNPGDSELYWCVNFDRFQQDARDQLLVAAVTRRFDENAGELMKILLQQMYVRTQPWAEVSNPIPFVELKDVIRKRDKHSQLLVYLEHYLTVLADDESRFISKVGDASGGQYTINLKNAVSQLTWCSVETIVMEKLDTKAARIFRLVRAKKFIEPEQIQQLAMIPSKEAKRLSYQLLEENFLQLQELRKAAGGSGGPNKSFVLFHIDIEQVVRMLLELCLKSLYNAVTRRHHDKQVNKRLIDKKHRVDTIAMSLKVQGAPEEQLQDIEDMITPPEKEMLERIGKVMKRLNLAELEIDDTIHLFQLYLSYHS